MTGITANFTLYAIRGQRFDHWDPGVFLAAFLAGTAALVVVSLVTRPEPEERLNAFFGRLEQPAVEGISLSAAGPEVAKIGHQLLLPNLLRLRRAAFGHPLMRAYRTDVLGFAVGWVLTLGIVAGLWAVFR